MEGGTVTRPCWCQMPELPEVEITRRHLADALEGRVLSDVRVGHVRTARHNSSPAEVEARLVNRTVAHVGRRGKFLRMSLDDGQTLVAHLGMSGRWVIGDDSAKPHTHFTAILDDGTKVDFVDPRTFGFVAVYDDSDLDRSGIARLGPDAWESPPTVAELADALDGRTAPIKALLLDQGPISGLGNIYADEALHLAQIHPLVPGGHLDQSDLERLLQAIEHVLSAAIDDGGTTLDDLAYLLPDGRSGEHMTRLAVYGRTDQPCLTCSTPITRLVVRARSTHFCAECQPAR